MEPTFLTRDELYALSARARAHGRLRVNRNLHAMDEPAHRLLNAIEPGSYVRVHRHLAPPKPETIVVVAGELGLVTYGDDGSVASAARLAACGDVYGADLPAGTWHTLVALVEGTVFFEVKPGPYVPPAGSDLAPWSPAEGDPGAERFREGLVALFER